MIGIRAGSVLLSTCAFALAAGAVYAQRGVSARAPGYQLACQRLAADRAQVKNVGRTVVPVGSMIEIRAAGMTTPAGGELHGPLRPGELWAPVSKMPAGFASCDATVAAKPLADAR